MAADFAPASASPLWVHRDRARPTRTHIRGGKEAVDRLDQRMKRFSPLLLLLIVCTLAPAQTTADSAFLWENFPKTQTVLGRYVAQFRADNPGEPFASWTVPQILSAMSDLVTGQGLAAQHPELIAAAASIKSGQVLSPGARPAATVGQPAQDTALLETVAQLTRRVEQLEQQVAALTAAPRAASPVSEPKPPAVIAPKPPEAPKPEKTPAADNSPSPEAWAKLRPGLTRDEVRALLGEPLRTTSEYWYYSTSKSHRRVYFLNDVVYNWKN